MNNIWSFLVTVSLNLGLIREMPKLYLAMLNDLSQKVSVT